MKFGKPYLMWQEVDVSSEIMKNLKKENLELWEEITLKMTHPTYTYKIEIPLKEHFEGIGESIILDAHVVLTHRNQVVFKIWRPHETLKTIFIGTINDKAQYIHYYYLFATDISSKEYLSNRIPLPNYVLKSMLDVLEDSRDIYRVEIKPYEEAFPKVNEKVINDKSNIKKKIEIINDEEYKESKFKKGSLTVHLTTDENKQFDKVKELIETQKDQKSTDFLEKKKLSITDSSDLNSSKINSSDKSSLEKNILTEDEKLITNVVNDIVAFSNMQQVVDVYDTANPEVIKKNVEQAIKDSHPSRWEKFKQNKIRSASADKKLVSSEVIKTGLTMAKKFIK